MGFTGEYKPNIFSKAEKIYIDIHREKIEGRAYVKNVEGDFNEFAVFDVSMDNVLNVSMVTFEKNPALEIKIVKKEMGKKASYYLYLLGLTDIKGAYNCLVDATNNYAKYLEEKRQLEIVQKKKEIDNKEKSEKYYQETYDKYIGNDDVPHYIFESDYVKLTALYIDEEKNINIISIDGNECDYTLGVILAKNIHYYEKAGAIHYTTLIDAEHNTFGGSFKPAQWNLKPAVLGGVLFGTLGMTAGLVKGHQPAEVQPSHSTFKISSDIEKIDDRSVILNYYSETKREYVDIELPQDIYNYLQTYLPEKKYDIALEIEKKQIIDQHIAIEKEQNIELPVEKEQGDKQLVSIDEFKEKLEKLKLMKDAGLLDEDEFLVEKNKLLSLI